MSQRPAQSYSSKLGSEMTSPKTALSALLGTINGTRRHGSSLTSGEFDLISSRRVPFMELAVSFAPTLLPSEDLASGVLCSTALIKLRRDLAELICRTSRRLLLCRDRPRRRNGSLREWRPLIASTGKMFGAQLTSLGSFVEFETGQKETISSSEEKWRSCRTSHALFLKWRLFGEMVPTVEPATITSHLKASALLTSCGVCPDLLPPAASSLRAGTQNSEAQLFVVGEPSVAGMVAEMCTQPCSSEKHPTRHMGNYKVFAET